jgi:hypothetical protein
MRKTAWKLGMGPMEAWTQSQKDAMARRAKQKEILKIKTGKR